MGKLFLTTTFTPMMLTRAPWDLAEKRGHSVAIEEISLEDALFIIQTEENREIVPAIGHETTSRMLETLTGLDNLFDRVNIDSIGGDSDDDVLAIIPGFRAEESREYTREELEAAEFRCFITMPNVMGI
jgi:hypothetical protein